MAEERYTEPVPVPDVFVTGANIERLDGNVRIVAWVAVAGERRIVGRWLMPGETARRLVADLGDALM